MTSALFPLIHALSSGRKDYVLIVGAGVSKDAGLPSGWDIYMKTLRDAHRQAVGVAEMTEEDLLKWSESTTEFNGSDYSSILSYCKPGEIERREYLREFFQGKVAGQAHKKIAQLVANGLIRFIFTTNFDDLLERALEEAGIMDFDVIKSDDELQKTVSWDKVRSCRIYKLHGDYRVGSLKNTRGELERLSEEMASDFRYICERHGIVTIGYSGRDRGLMREITERKHGNYSIFWQVKDLPQETDEYKPFWDLSSKCNECGNPMRQLVYSSAADFLSTIIDGIDRLRTQVLLETSTDPMQMAQRVANLDEKKHFVFQSELVESFKGKFDVALAKEAEVRQWVGRYEIYQDYLKSLGGLWQYFGAYSLCPSADWESGIVRVVREISEYVQKRSPGRPTDFVAYSIYYHVVMYAVCGLMKGEAIRGIENIIKLKYRDNGRYIGKLCDEIGHSSEGWGAVGNHLFNRNYSHPKYSITLEYLLPGTIDPR